MKVVAIYKEIEVWNVTLGIHNLVFWYVKGVAASNTSSGMRLLVSKQFSIYVITSGKK